MAVEKLTYPASQGTPGGTLTSAASSARGRSKVATVVPQITSTPVTQAVAGLTMNYQVKTNAATTEQLTYMLVTAPAGMAISSSGKISWVPAIGTTSPQRVDVRIIDQFGNFFDQVFSIRVSGPNPFIPASVVTGSLRPAA